MVSLLLLHLCVCVCALILRWVWFSWFRVLKRLLFDNRWNRVILCSRVWRKSAHEENKTRSLWAAFQPNGSTEHADITHASLWQQTETPGADKERAEKSDASSSHRPYAQTHTRSMCSAVQNSFYILIWTWQALWSSILNQRAAMRTLNSQNKEERRGTGREN